MALAAVASSLLAFNAGAVVDYAFDPGGINDLTSADVPSKATTFTQVFTVQNGSINISALGVYGFELINNVGVAIYNSSSGGVISGSALASETFGHAQQVASDYTYLSTSLNLGAGTYALVTFYTGGFGTSGYYSGDPSDITHYSGSLLTLGNLYRKTGTGLPSLQDKTALGSGNMAFSSVPEVGLFGVAGVGLLGMVYVGRGLALRRCIARV